jgi:hypothetical protein
MNTKPIRLNPVLTAFLGAPSNTMTDIGEAEFRLKLNDAIKRVVLQAFSEEELARYKIFSMLD